jgi:hypothetical protein
VGPEQRLSALVAIRRDVELVEARRDQGSDRVELRTAADSGLRNRSFTEIWFSGKMAI